MGSRRRAAAAAADGSGVYTGCYTVIRNSPKEADTCVEQAVCVGAHLVRSPTASSSGSARTVGTLLPVQTHSRPGGCGAHACPVTAKATPTSVFCTNSLRNIRKCAEFSGVGKNRRQPRCPPGRGLQGPCESSGGKRRSGPASGWESCQ